MPCAVTAFSVKIASLSDAAIESIIAREVIGEWNARHALEHKRVLLPLYSDGERTTSTSDLLIAFFCDAKGTSGDRALGCGEAEIEAHLSAGKPALVYFSDARVDLHGDHMPQGRALDEFKKRYASATVDSYGDEKEYRAKFARQLDAIIGSHALFKADAPVPSPTAVFAVPEEPVPPPAVPLSVCAQTILSEACDDFEAYIGRIEVGDSLRIQANGKQLVEQGNAATVAKWESAFQELLRGGFIHDAGCNGNLFQISTKGFEFLKTIGKTPVGYIAELGGM